MRRDRGMTILEVVVALTILMIGVGFVYGGNKVVFKYKAQHELRQQMFFYGAGLLEATLEGVNISETMPGISADPPKIESVAGLEDLEMVTITVEGSADIEPVVLKTMRLKP